MPKGKNIQVPVLFSSLILVLSLIKKNYSRKERRGGDKGTEGSGFTPAAGCLQLQHIHLLSCGCIWLCLCVTGATRKGSGVSDHEKDYRFGLWKTKYLPVLIS